MTANQLMRKLSDLSASLSSDAVDQIQQGAQCYDLRDAVIHARAAQSMDKSAGLAAQLAESIRQQVESSHG